MGVLFARNALYKLNNNKQTKKTPRRRRLFKAASPFPLLLLSFFPFLSFRPFYSFKSALSPLLFLSFCSKYPPCSLTYIWSLFGEARLAFSARSVGETAKCCIALVLSSTRVVGLSCHADSCIWLHTAYSILRICFRAFSGPDVKVALRVFV